MSWYYCYYIGKKVNNKIEVIGMYDNNGKIHPVLERSRSFASSLKDYFNRFEEIEELEELKDILGAEYISICPYKNLPKGDFVKAGYFLIEDVTQYLKEHDAWDLFYDKLSPEVYAERLKIERILGAPKPKVDEEGNVYEVHSCSDYMYFAYPDYSCEEYEAFMIKYAVEMLQPYNYERDDIVIILGEG